MINVAAQPTKRFETCRSRLTENPKIMTIIAGKYVAVNTTRMIPRVLAALLFFLIVLISSTLLRTQTEHLKMFSLCSLLTPGFRENVQVYSYDKNYAN